MDRAWQAQIEKEYASLKADEAVLHNKELHEHILANWKAYSPNMWANLRTAGPSFADKLAYVLQERMWLRLNSLMGSGMSYTDAQEAAEKEALMLEPEEEILTEDRLDPWTPPLPKHVLDASAQCNNEEMSLQTIAKYPMHTEPPTQRELELLEAVAAIRPAVRRRIQKDMVLEIVAVIALLMVLKLVFG